MKGKMIRKSTYKMKTRGKFFIQTAKDLIQTIIGVHYGTLDLQTLLESEMTSGYVMKNGFFRMMLV